MRTPILLLAATLAATSQAGSLLGLDNSRVYRIDATTGVATSVGLLGGSGDANALAYNPLTNTAYYQRNGKLWSMSVATGVSMNLNVAVGDTAAATWHDGAYWFMSQGDGKLSRVAFSGATPGAATLFRDYTNAWGFGDIATNAAGKLYGSSGSSVFSVDLNAANPGVVSESTHGTQTQLGFVGATLYGIATGNASGGGTGQIFTFAGTTGMTATGVIAKYQGAALAIRDASSFDATGTNPVPEPASMAVLGLGLAGALRRRKKA